MVKKKEYGKRRFSTDVAQIKCQNCLKNFPSYASVCPFCGWNKRGD